MPSKQGSTQKKRHQSDSDSRRFPLDVKVFPITARLIAEIKRRLDSPLPPDAPSGPETQQFMKEMRELDSWLSGAPTPRSEEEIRKFLEDFFRECKSMGSDYSKTNAAMQLYERLLRARPRGRPVVNRPLAVKALDMKISNPRYSWTRVAQKLCPPGQENAVLWRENLRQEVITLQKVLRKYGIPCN